MAGLRRRLRPRAGAERGLMALLRDTRGATAMLVGIGFIPMIGAAGLAVDASMGFILKSRLSRSLDAAGLAAGRVALNDNAEEIAREYFDANFGPGVGSAAVVDFSMELDPTRQFVTLTAEAETPTIFMRVFGFEDLSVEARTIIERQTTGMELALVLDNTGSMWGPPFTAMQTAAFDLVNIIYGDESEIENLWVSVVPFVATVNIGPSRTGWLATGDPYLADPNRYSPDPRGWAGCVMARAHPYDSDDTPPAMAPFTTYYYPATTRTQDNNWPAIRTSIADENRGSSSDRNTARGPNLGCGSPITSLTQSKATIDAALAAMGPIHRGGTTGNLGLSWGWRTISPQWRGLWGGETPATHPLDYGTPLMEKVVVLLSDGNNQFHDQDSGGGPPSDFTAYGRLNAPGPVGLNVSTISAGNSILDSRMTGTCSAMKAQGIKIYTIIFGAAPNASTQTLYRNCATSPGMYYYAPNNATIAAAFRAIGGELANLRIVE